MVFVFCDFLGILGGVGTRLINYLEETVYNENHELYLNLLSLQDLNEYDS